MSNPFGVLFSSEGESSASERAKSSRREMLQTVLNLSSPECEADLSALEHVLFESLMGENYGAPVTYLVSSYFKIRPENGRGQEPEYALVKELIIRNLSTGFIEPELYESNTSVSQQFVDVFLGEIEEESLKRGLLVDIAERLVAEGEDLYEKFMLPVLEVISKVIVEDTTYMGISGNPHSVPAINSLKYFLVQDKLAESFMLYNFPRSAPPLRRGIDFARTLLGRLLNRSCIPESELSPSQYFEKPSHSASAEHSATESRIWIGLQSLQSMIFDLFKSALKQGPKAKHLTLKWIGDCLMLNGGRSKIWTNEGLLMASGHVSDGFMMNLGAVLLKLCDPFTKGVKNSKMLKIDSSYTGSNINMNTNMYLEQNHRNMEQQ